MLRTANPCHYQNSRKPLACALEQPKLTSFWKACSQLDTNLAPEYLLDTEDATFSDDPGSITLSTQEPCHLPSKDDTSESSGRESGPDNPSIADFLSSSQKYLTSCLGRKRSDKEAKKIILVTKRYLAHPGGGLDTLQSPSHLTTYMVTLEKSEKLAASLQATLLNRLKTAVTYYESTLPSPDNNLQRMQRSIGNWCATLQKEARAVARDRLEELSDKPIPETTDVQKFLDNSFVPSIFTKTLEACKRNAPVDDSDMRTCTLWLAGSLLLSNHQRPGAITDMQLGEFLTATNEKDGRDTYVVISVRQHKTGTTGRARIVAKTHLAKRLQQYVKYIRPLLPPAELVFPNMKGGKIDHLSRRVQQLGSKMHLNLPTATAERHQAATIAAKTLDERGQQQVALLMSHSRSTQMRYYQATKSKEEALHGYKALEGVQSTRAFSEHSRRERFTEEAVALIKKEFELYIADGVVPPAKACKWFVEENSTTRSHKQIRDKIHNVIESARK